MRAARWIRLVVADPLELRWAASGLAAVQEERAAPIVLWAREAAWHSFVLIVPKLLAPGRRERWVAWALSPAIATLRGFGMRAYLEEPDIRLHGKSIANGRAQAMGECVVVSSGFPLRLPVGGRPPSEPELENRFRTRIEAQHDWQFETAWPSGVETAAIAEARLEPAGY